MNRISILCIALLMTASFSARTVAQLQRLAKPNLTPEQLRTYRLHEIDQAIKEKLRGQYSQEEPASRSNGDREESTLGEVKVSTGTPESEVHAAINPTDTTNIVCSPIHNGSTFNLPIYYSKNFGQTWTKSSFSPVPGITGISITGGGDPVFAYDADGKLYYTWIDTWTVGGAFTTYGGMYWASSTDGGKTWQRSANSAVTTSYTAYNSATFQIDSTTGFDDKEWMAVDRSKSQYRNTMYITWTRLGQDSACVMIARKLPNSDSTETPVRVSSDSLIKVQYTSIGIDAHGGVHVTYMGSTDLANFGIYHAYSGDGGKTFHPEEIISAADIPGNSSDAVGDYMFGVRTNGNYPCPHLSIDTAKTGNLYMVWNAYGIDQDLGNGADIYFSRSTDNGQTWSAATIVNSDSVRDNVVDHFYPSIAVGGNGIVNVTWYDRREDSIDNQIGRYYLGQSSDGGKTWSNAAVATKPMDFAHVQDKDGGQPSGFGIGEYTQVLVTPYYTIPVWSDDRTNDGNLRVYASFIPASNAATSGVTQRVTSVEGGIELLDNYPNPANTNVRTGFRITSAANALLTITNIRGGHVATLFDGLAQDGEHDMTFDASSLVNGIYYLTLESDLGFVSKAFTVNH